MYLRNLATIKFSTRVLCVLAALTFDRLFCRRMPH